MQSVCYLVQFCRTRLFDLTGSARSQSAGTLESSRHGELRQFCLLSQRIYQVLKTHLDLPSKRISRQRSLPYTQRLNNLRRHSLPSDIECSEDQAALGSHSGPSPALIHHSEPPAAHGEARPSLARQDRQNELESLITVSFITLSFIYSKLNVLSIRTPVVIC